jgi:hypothetical protein
MAVSLIDLFARSRFRQTRIPSADKEEEARRCEQKERFAVAMIGLVLQHDASFREHFLKNICGMESDSTDDSWDIAVEPANWGDLVMEQRGGGRPRQLLVVEFKIEAELAAHQTPGLAEFVQPGVDQCEGYGRAISRYANEKNWPLVKYVTVQKAEKKKHTRPLNDPATSRPPIECFESNWNAFVRPEESKLEGDLYDCLAGFNLPIFTSRKMKKTTLAAAATKPFALLKSVLAMVEVSCESDLLEMGQESFGLNLRSEDFPVLANKTASNRPIFGWFGYESDQSDPRLSVWLYSHEPDNTLAFCAGVDGGNEKTKHRHDGKCVNIYLSGEDSTGDLEWFVAVLMQLKDKATQSAVAAAAKKQNIRE